MNARPTELVMNGEAVDIAGRTAVKRGRVFHEPALRSSTSFLISSGNRRRAWSAGHLELVFDLRDARSPEIAFMTFFFGSRASRSTGSTRC